jgi:hypothetical protein
VTGRRLVWFALAASIALLVVWIASRTTWVEVSVPMPLKGQAAVNPFYAAQRFAEALGARTEWERRFDPPEVGAIVVASYWNWNLTAERRGAMKRWVESGGRLVVDRAFLAGGDDFERWSGIAYARPGTETSGAEGGGGAFIAEAAAPFASPPCMPLTEVGSGAGPPARSNDAVRTDDVSRRYTLCGFDPGRVLTSVKRPAWGLRGDAGFEAIRADVGLGSVTVVNATPFLRRALFDGDHARIFAAATQLRSGDEVRFLSEDDYPSLLALAWRFGAPVVLLVSIFAVLALWRGGVRFGPVAAPTETARRSLAEQIRGTGRFALRFGGGAALHTAAVRALHEAAARRIPGYERLPPHERAAALVREAGLDAGGREAGLEVRRDADIEARSGADLDADIEARSPADLGARRDAARLGAALGISGTPARREVASAVALLESVRRKILLGNTRSKRGTT